MEKCRLAELPNELLTQILSYIVPLAKIALLSKHFKALVELLLYRHISLNVRYSAKELSNTRIVNRFSYTTIPSFVPFDRLIENLSVNPNLGKSVQSLSLRVHRRLWYSQFDAYSRLLERLPELQSLSLSPPPLRSNISNSDWPLNSLRLDFNHVTDHYDESGEWLHLGIPLQIIAQYLRLPRLRKVQAENVLLTPRFDETRHLLQGSSSVDDLRFLDCCEARSDRVVAAFLTSIKRLKRFVIEFSSQLSQAALIPRHSHEYGLALSAHQETIEELVVATSKGSHMIGWTLGPFTRWSSLKRLAVPGYMIRGRFTHTRNLHDVLPPLLEEFQVEHLAGHYNCNLRQVAYQRLVASSQPETTLSRVLSQVAPQGLIKSSRPAKYKSRVDAARAANDVTDMKRLAENKNSRVPRLKRVIWWYQKPTNCAFEHSENPTNLHALVEIYLAFRMVGVTFEWVTEPFFKDTPFGKRLCEWHG